MLRVAPERLALRTDSGGVTAEVSYDGRGYAMPPEAAGMAGTLYLYRAVHIVAGRYQAQHPRYVEKGTARASPSTAPRTWRRSRANAAAAICSVSICWRPGRRPCSS